LDFPSGGYWIMNLANALRARIWIADGAMGTRLFQKGVNVNRCLEELNLTNPSLVAEIHREYRDAGANLLETNTFGANAARLALRGLEGHASEINIAGVRLAKAAAGSDGLVAGAVGPLGRRDGDARAIFAAQIEALAEGGADLILLETFRDLAEIREAIVAARTVCTLPVIAQISPDDDGLLSGAQADSFVPQLIASGADAIGCNCGAGPAGTLVAIQQIARRTTVPLTAQPSAGLPVQTGSGLQWPCSPAEMAQFAVQMVHNGVRIIGGCCGTTPGHIRAIRAAVLTAG
jgi:homocysteine S-methyltransferase